MLISRDTALLKSLVIILAFCLRDVEMQAEALLIYTNGKTQRTWISALCAGQLLEAIACRHSKVQYRVQQGFDAWDTVSPA